MICRERYIRSTLSSSSTRQILESQSYYYRMSMSENHRHFSNHALLASEPDVQCLVCTRPFALDTEVTDSFEALAICSECKMMVLNENERDVTTSEYRRRRRRRGRSSTASFESFEDAFSQQFLQLINLARQGHEADVDSAIIVPQHISYSSTPNRSQRWHASDSESDGLDYVDSVFGEIESRISFGGYGGDSDASLDQQSLIDRDMIIQLDNESFMNTDTDIDPMNAGLHQWNSDDQEDEDVEWEVADFDEAVEAMEQHQQQLHDTGPSGLSEQESRDGWRMTISQGSNIPNILTDMEGLEIRPRFVGNPDDYVDARQFEALLEQLAENDGTRRGAPPTATSFVEKLSSVVISSRHERNGDVICPVCKDAMPIHTNAKQLPCRHLYHLSCILPWLSSRNTCPVCRYELPTDDPEYERSKRVTTNERDTHMMQQTQQQEIAEEISSEPEVEEAPDIIDGVAEETTTSERAVHVNRERGRGRWLFLAAAPIVSVVGFVLVLCFRNPPSIGRRQLCHRSLSTTAVQVDGTRRRWWSML